MTIIAIVLAGIIWSAAMILTGYMLRRVDEEVEKAEIRARIFEAIRKREEEDNTNA